MDRGAKTLRQKHRELGHDLQSLMEMSFNPIIRQKHKLTKYTIPQIFQTWQLHKIVDGWDSAFGAMVRNKVKGYAVKSKKESVIDAINRLKKEVLRL